jgi:CheY-like chemotaxis protein
MGVCSQEGKGSAFHFTTRFESFEPAQSAQPADDAGADPVGPLSILVAEDDPVSQTLVSSLLKPHGHSITLVSNGSQAFSALERRTFDLVLMDIQMPGMDGLEVTAKIRERERETGGHTPIIALTAHALRGDQQRCLQGGMDGYVSKPVHAGDLQAAITAAMRMSVAGQ